MMRKNKMLLKYVPSVLLFLLFEAVAVALWIAKDNLFYLLNFSYSGGCLALGTVLFTAGKRYARHFVQLAVGGYMLLYLGIISREICSLRAFGTICSWVFSRRQRFIMRWQRFLDRWSSGGDGAAMPAGQLWCWIFCLTRSRKRPEKKS